MMWNPLKLFRRKRVEVRPLDVIGTEAMVGRADQVALTAQQILAGLIEQGLLPANTKVRVIGTGGVEIARPGLKPPADPAVDGWTWAKWKREFDANELDGWGFCRFANRTGPDNVNFVFGWVSGPFGIWEQPFECCDAEEGDGRRILAALTHLPSGLGFGLFKTRELAAIAAEAIEVMVDWREVDPANDAQWRFINDEFRNLWVRHGIVPNPHAHAHLEDRTAAIWHHDPEAIPATVNPEKLS